MLKKRIIPTLLWKKIGVVKGEKFDSWRNVGSIMPSIKIYNRRYKAIILGKNGQTIKKIRENSQKEISQIFNSKIHLYLEVVIINAK